MKIIYSGQWVNGKMDGKGIYKYLNGDVFEGEFKDGLKHGKDVYTFYLCWNNRKRMEKW